MTAHQLLITSLPKNSIERGTTLPPQEYSTYEQILKNRRNYNSYTNNEAGEYDEHLAQTLKSTYINSLQQLNTLPIESFTKITGRLIYHAAHQGHNGVKVIKEILQNCPKAQDILFQIKGDETSRPVSLDGFLANGVDVGNPKYDTIPFPKADIASLSKYTHTQNQR